MKNFCLTLLVGTLLLFCTGCPSSETNNNAYEPEQDQLNDTGPAEDFNERLSQPEDSPELIREPDITITAIDLENGIKESQSDWIGRRIIVTGIVYDTPENILVDQNEYLGLWAIELPMIVRTTPGTDRYDSSADPLVFCLFRDKEVENYLNDNLVRDVDEVSVEGTVTQVKEIDFGAFGGKVLYPILDWCILLSPQM